MCGKELICGIEWVRSQKRLSSWQRKDWRGLTLSRWSYTCFSRLIWMLQSTIPWKPEIKEGTARGDPAEIIFTRVKKVITVSTTLPLAFEIIKRVASHGSSDFTCYICIALCVSFPSNTVQSESLDCSDSHSFTCQHSQQHSNIQDTSRQDYITGRVYSHWVSGHSCYCGQKLWLAVLSGLTAAFWPLTVRYFGCWLLKICTFCPDIQKYIATPPLPQYMKSRCTVVVVTVVHIRVTFPV